MRYLQACLASSLLRSATVVAVLQQPISGLGRFQAEFVFLASGRVQMRVVIEICTAMGQLTDES